MGLTLKHSCCSVNLLKRKNKNKTKNHSSSELLAIQNRSCSMNLLCLLSSRWKQGKKRTKDPYYFYHPQTKLKHVSIFRQAFSVSPCSASVENNFINGEIWLQSRDSPRCLTKESQSLYNKQSPYHHFSERHSHALGKKRAPAKRQHFKSNMCSP